MNAYIDGGRLNRLRTARGTTQADLATRVNVPMSVFNRIENNSLPIDDELVVRIAHVLDCATDFLSHPVPESLYSRPWLRAYADAPKKTVDQHVADTLVALEVFAKLKLRRIPERLPLFDGDPNSDDDIEDFASDVRLAADVDPSGAVRNVTRAAERLGCIVLPLDSELGKHLGMSMIVDGTPVLRASRPAGDGGIPGDRQRFTVAHELGHVTMHATYPPPITAEAATLVEKQAHRFAGAFLLPGDAFLEDLNNAGGRVTLSTLAKLKVKWGVAIKAMVVRLHNLHRIDADQARSLYKQVSARNWNKREPAPTDNERAVWLTQALDRRFPDASDILAAAANYTGVGRSYFVDWSSWQPDTRSEADVIAFARPPRL